MKVAEVGRRHVVSIDREGSLMQAASLMREHHVGAVVVTARDGQGPHVCGMVTDRDLVIEVLARGLDGTRVRIGELASGQVHSVSQDDDLASAVGLMQQAGVRRLLVTDGDRQVTGMLALDDLLHACAIELDGLAGVIRSGIAREAATTSGPAQPALLLPRGRAPAARDAVNA